MNWYKKSQYDPFSVDFTKEQAKAKKMKTPSLFAALKDAIEAIEVSPNAGKYADQASVYRRELENRGIGIAEQDRTLAMLPSAHTPPKPPPLHQDDFGGREDFSNDYDPYAGTGWEDQYDDH